VTQDASQVVTRAKRELDTVLLQQIDSAYNFARWAMGHPAAAENVVEDLMTGTQRTQTGHRGTRGRAWVLQEVRIVALRRLGAASCADPDQTFADLAIPAKVCSSIGARAAGIELQPSAVELLRRAVAGLSLEHREIVLLRDTEGLSYREIAGMTGLPQSALMARLSRARDTLEACLADPPAASTHEGMLELIDAYVDAEVDIDTAVAFVQHIATCRDCACRVLNRSRLVQQIRSVTTCRAPDGLRKRIQKQLG
jgi:RNA polymerase sigma-70 factor (ECF subfamily)